MADQGEYTIGELADLAGVTTRAIRYYISIGVLPAPEPAGPKTRYTSGHLNRLRLIRKLQRRHLPLAEIRRQLNQFDDSKVAAALDAENAGPPADSALEYIKRLAGGLGLGMGLGMGLGSASGADTGPVLSPGAPAPPTTHGSPRGPGHGVMAEPRVGSPARAERASGQPEAQLDFRTRWERVAIGDDVEFHILQPLDRRKQEQIERLIRLAREMIEEWE